MAAFNWSSAVLVFTAVIIKIFSVSFLVYQFRPTWLLKIWKRIRVLRAGLSKHYIKVNDELEISYLERKGEKDGQILLFLHGFTGEKEIYSDLVRLMSKNFHVILVDLPGHGESKPNDGQSDYRIDAQVDSVHKFVKAIGLNERKFNLIGASMGGHIAGVYAARYGETLSSVVLLYPAGINSPEVSQFFIDTKKNLDNNVDSNVLLPQDSEQMQELLKLVLYHDVKIPLHFAGAFVKLKKEKMVAYKKVMDDLLIPDQHHLLDGVLEDIKVPLLCLWGKHDKGAVGGVTSTTVDVLTKAIKTKVLHVSGSDVIKERVKNAEVHLVERCGHAIVIDRPRKFLKILVQFLDKINA